MPSLNLISPAKLNLFLHITGRRADGYHNLQTLFQILDYGDQLHFEINAEHANSDKIELVSNLKTVNFEDNLIVKAARLLQKQQNCPQGAKIILKKILPLGGGLGGGSSNAATTLLALNKLWNCQLSLKELAELGLALGADIPVFVLGHTAWAEGVGEILSPMSLPEDWFVVLTPTCHASTIEIFCHEQLTRRTSPIKIPAFPIPDSKNDCEQVAILLYPEIENALKWLTQFAPARMTGTGASVFASFSSKQEAEQVLQQHLPEATNGFIARGVNVSPLHRSLSDLKLSS